MLQQTCQIKYDEKLNKWKNHITDLEDQIRVLQHEVTVIYLINQKEFFFILNYLTLFSFCDR